MFYLVVLVLALQVAGCTRPPQIVVEPDPGTQSKTAYGTLLLDPPTERVVVAVAVGQKDRVQLTVWTSQAQCDRVVLQTSVSSIAPDIDTSDTWTPSGSDRTLSFTVSRSVLAELGTAPATISICQERWPLDDEDRRVIAELIDASQ